MKWIYGSIEDSDSTKEAFQVLFFWKIPSYLVVRYKNLILSITQRYSLA
jgi:hypothetical protein